MDRFQDGHHVRLRSRVRRNYIHAAEDGESVTLSQVRVSMNAAWAVHIYNGDDGPYLLLYSAAYGRYLAATATPARLGHHGLRAELRDYNQSELEAITWRAVGSGFADDVVLLRNVGGLYLRSNGRYVRWNVGVSVDNSVSSMMYYWVVESIPAREDMPALPAPPPIPPWGPLPGAGAADPVRAGARRRALPRGPRERRLAPDLVQGQVRVSPEGRPGVPPRRRRVPPEHRHVRSSGPPREADPARRRPARRRLWRHPRDCRLPGRHPW
ncbi:hypothetical protein VPH35_034543 [Triticum aestivum]